MSFGVHSASSDGTGYKRASVGTHEYMGGTTPAGSLLSDGLTNRFTRSATEALFEGQSMSSRMASVVDPTAEVTVPTMTALTGNTYQASMPTGQNTFSADSSVTTGAAASLRVNASISNVQEMKGKMVADFKEARAEVCKAVYGVAGNEKGAAALDSMGAFDHGATKASAAMVAASSNIGGLPLNIFTILNEISGETKKISKDEQERIMTAALDRLRSQQKTPEEQVAFAGPTASAPAKDNKKKFDWEKVDAKDLMALVGGTPENQPEFKALERQESALMDMKANHKFVEANYGNNITAGKIDAAGGISDMEVAQIIVASGGGHEKVAQTPQYDSGNVWTTGYFMRDLDMSNMRVAQPLPSVKVVADALTTEDRRSVLEIPPPAIVSKMTAGLFG